MTKNELQRIRTIDHRIDSKLRQLDELKSDKYNIKSPDYSKDRVQGGGSTSEDRLISILELEREITKDIDELIDMKLRCLKRIRQVQGYEGVVLEMRYIEGLEFEDIASELDKSVQQIYRYHGHGLIVIKNL